MKDLEKVKTIIRCQITQNIIASTINIDQSTFIRDFIIKKKLIDCNIYIILIKVGSVIKMPDPKSYNETNLRK